MGAEENCWSCWSSPSTVERGVKVRFFFGDRKFFLKKKEGEGPQPTGRGLPAAGGLIRPAGGSVQQYLVIFLFLFFKIFFLYF